MITRIVKVLKINSRTRGPVNQELYVKGNIVVTEEIDIALKSLLLSESEIRLVRSDRAELLFHELLEYFVEGGDSGDRRWWWESFSQPSKYVQFHDDMGFKRISNIVPDVNESVWFVVEDDQLPFYPIYETTPEVIQKVIGECYGFEYYIIPKSKEWLLCENHHGNLIGLGKTIINKLVQYDT